MVREHPIEDGRAPSEAVYTALARERDCSPLELPPLAEAVDPDALDAVLDGPGPDEVSFEYCGHVVTVTEDTVHLRPLDG